MRFKIGEMVTVTGGEFVKNNGRNGHVIDVAHGRYLVSVNDVWVACWYGSEQLTERVDNDYKLIVNVNDKYNVVVSHKDADNTRKLEKIISDFDIEVIEKDGE